MDRADELEIIIAKARKELSEIKTNERLLENKDKVGKFYKYHNCYSCPKDDSDYWWEYQEIISMDEYGDLHSIEFSIDKDGKLSMENNNYASVSGWIEIEKTEFQIALNTFITKANLFAKRISA